MNQVKQYPTTLQHAKELSKRSIGRLPRCGYEIIIGAVYTADGRMDYRLSLMNISGKYVLSVWERPFSNPDMSKFTMHIK